MMMFTKRQHHHHHQEQREQPPPEPPDLPPCVPPVVGIVPAPWNLKTTTTTNMEQLLELDQEDDDESSTRKNNTNHWHDCDKYVIVGPLQHHYLPHPYPQYEQQQQQHHPRQQQHQTLYVYLSGLLQRLGQAASPVERYRSLQELYAILCGSSSPTTRRTTTAMTLSEGDGRVEMLLNHSGDSVLCWQLAYITQSQIHRPQHRQQQQQGGGVDVDVAVLALLLECLALIWTPKSSSSSVLLLAQPPSSLTTSSFPKMDNSRVQSMKQAAHTTLPILLQVGDAFSNDARIQKPLLFILRLYTKIRHVPTKSMLVKSGLVVHLRRALERHRDAATEPFMKTTAAAAAAPLLLHVNNNKNNINQEENLAPCILGLMKDLLFRAESTEKLYMYEEWHNVVLGNGGATTTCLDDEADQVASAEAISACLWNWAVSDDLARRMAQDPAVCETLHAILSMPNEKQQQQQPQMPHLLASPRDQEEDDDYYEQQQYPSSSRSNNHHDNIWANVHRNALAALGTMIASCTVTTRSFGSSNNNHNNNETTMTAVLRKQAWLVPCLCQILDRNEDKDSRRRCIRILRCLSSCSWGRAFLLVQPPPAVVPNPSHNTSSSSATLGSSQQHQQQNHNHQLLTLFLRCLQRQDEEVDTRIQASLAIAALLPSFNASEWMAMGPYFETALVQTIEDAAADSDDKLVLTAIQALQVCLDHNPWKRGGSGCFSHLFFESTLRVLRNQMCEPSYHAAFASLILHLVHQKKMSSTSGGGGKSLTTILLICPPVAEILSTLLTPLGPDFEASRSEALQAIVALTTMTASTSNGQNVNDEPNDVVVVADNENYRKNLKTLATNECLLNNLVNLCLIAPTFKDQAKSAILKLVPEL